MKLIVEIPINVKWLYDELKIFLILDISLNRHTVYRKYRTHYVLLSSNKQPSWLQIQMSLVNIMVHKMYILYEVNSFYTR